ncbi:hypothetical protein RHMOL_Rhmol01G0165800 [Rhododendron molle]|uniref:Uncharacterized protein n=1 Tax=Rhododendron molle TaxID=49168 RepID=A0ACC0Q433_RHOML|nr:hypothetical protein RHMOL_Rhmol01G0165800 [Rhododendron molle]
MVRPHGFWLGMDIELGQFSLCLLVLAFSNCGGRWLLILLEMDVSTAIIRTSTIFSLYISFSLFSFSIAFAFSPAVHYLLDCGSTKPTTVDNNRRFTGDSSDSGSQFLKSSRSIFLRNSNPSPDSSPLYHAVRVFTRPSKYAFEIRGTHVVRLHFRPFDSSNFNTYDSKFHVSVNGYLLLYNFTVGKSQAPIIKDYVIWVDAEELVITFVLSEKSEIAFVNAIEVISAP